MSNADWLEAEQHLEGRRADYTPRERELPNWYDDAEEAEEAAKSKPIYRMPSAHQVEVLLANVESERDGYQERTGCSANEAVQWECGFLRALIRSHLCAAQIVERDLMRELQLALNETCNHYHNEGHAARVEKQYGLVMEEA